MKLVHPVLSGPIAFEEGRIAVLTIERPEVFRAFVTDLTRQAEGEDGEAVLSERGKVLDPACCLKVISDYVHFQPAEKRVLNRFMAAVQRSAHEELEQETRVLMQNIQNYLGRLALQLDHPVTYETGENILPLLKAAGFQLDFGELPPAEALMEELSFYHRMMGQACLVLVSAKDWLTEEELRQLYSAAQYQKWNLLLIETDLKGISLDAEDHILIDRDLCELRYEGGDRLDE